MADTAHRRWTLEEFLAWEARQDQRHEFVDGVVRAMAGGTQAHARIAVNILARLLAALRGTPCKPYGSDLKVITPAGNSRYPDVTVDCGPFRADETSAMEPTVLVEVYSKSTAATDLTDKLDEYQAISSVKHILHLRQAQARGELWTRTPDGWRRKSLEGLDAVAELDAIGVRLTLAEAYEDVPLGEEAGEE